MICQVVADLKRALPAHTIVALKCGEFYEMFGEDAIVSAPILGVTLSSRNGIPMCGFPCDEVDTCRARFVRAGKSVAFAERQGLAEWYGGYEIVEVI